MAENVFAVTQTPIGSQLILDAVDREALQTQRLALPAQNGAAQTQLVSCGSAIKDVEISIRDGEKTLPERHIGEVAVRSNCMLTEYYHRPDATAAVMLPDGWYLTGDLAIWRMGSCIHRAEKRFDHCGR